MTQFTIKHFGPIEHVSVQFADLTLLVGSQATGKSLFLQLLKLIIDKEHILYTLDKYSYILNKNPKRILGAYFGEGLSDIWRKETEVELDETQYTANKLLGTLNENATEHLFYIPAQRILSMNDGRLKNFMEFDTTTPYVLRYFSEILRLYMQSGLGTKDTIFPIQTRLKASLKKAFKENVYHEGIIVMDDRNGQKQMRMNIDGMSLPFMTWSAGQKEFMPLLLSFYSLLGPESKVVKKSHYKYVVIEEPEMGLHPQAILSVLLQIIELMQAGFKVIVSTHSTQPLEFAWAFNLLKEKSEHFGIKPLLKLFNLDNTIQNKKMLEGIWEKRINTYFFSREDNKVYSTNISTLDAGSENIAEREWGGLSEFAGKTSDIVSEYLWER